VLRVKFGIGLGALNPAFFEEIAVEADRLGFESLWLPEHLVFPLDMSGSPHPGEDTPPVPPTTPVFDAFAMLSYLAGRTERIRLGTNVYLLALRHPFAAARAVQTLDIVSRGRAEVGVGAGWLRQEWRAAGLDPATRGRRLDEAIEVCRRLWTEPEVAHHGEFYDFEAVAFEPKPVQRPHPPIHVGGESEAALARAARLGDGWLGLAHDAASVAEPLRRLHALRAACGRSERPFEVIVGARAPSPDKVTALAAAGVTRLIVTPWRRSREALEGVRSFASQHL
jgi:probable F420-dependent oxidoreductase